MLGYWMGDGKEVVVEVRVFAASAGVPTKFLRSGVDKLARKKVMVCRADKE